ncbi:SH3 domain-containing protein, partial [Mycena floridula]
YCRVLYDYEAHNPSTISLRRNEIIEILTQDQSGWWDGVTVNDKRGWFPSNYV